MKKPAAMTVTIGPEIDWKRILVGVVAANLLGSIFFITTQEFVLLWAIYPILLVVGLRYPGRGGMTGLTILFVSSVLFLLIHLPYTLLGPGENICRDCSQILVWVVMFILPLLTALITAGVWHQMLLSHYSDTENTG